MKARGPWREVPGTDGMYEVNDRGQVRSWSWFKKGELLTPALTNGDGFLTVNLRVDGKKKKIPVHLLVAAAFIGPKPEGAKVRHVNGDRTDNRAVNLRYGSAMDCIYDQLRREALEKALLQVREEVLKQPVCPNGHPLNSVNAYEHEGEIKCRACVLEKLARFRREKPTTPLEELARPAALV